MRSAGRLAGRDGSAGVEMPEEEGAGETRRTRARRIELRKAPREAVLAGAGVRARKEEREAGRHRITIGLDSDADSQQRGIVTPHDIGRFVMVEKMI